MDIDKFLEKELSGESTSSASSSTPVEIPLTPPATKADFESEIKSILSNIREYIKEQKLELVEQTYASLWTTLTDTDFAWDESLYKEIHEINALLYKEYNPLLDSFTRQVQVIRNLIRDGRRMVAENKIEQSLKVYHEVSVMAKELVNVSFAEKKAIEREVLRLYRDIHERVGLQTIEKVRALTKQAMGLIGKLRPFLVSGNISKAAEIHHMTLMLYNQIPFGFLSSKLQLGKELLESYKLIAIQLRIRDLRNELPLFTQRKLSPRQLGRQRLRKTKEKQEQPETKTQAVKPAPIVQPPPQYKPVAMPPPPTPAQSLTPMQAVPQQPPLSPQAKELLESLESITQEQSKKSHEDKPHREKPKEQKKEADPFEALSDV